MSDENQRSDQQFTLVARGPSAAILFNHEQLQVPNFPAPWGPVVITVRTRWITRAEGVTVPGHLWIEVTGPAPSLDHALQPFATAGLVFLPILSLSANAAISDIETELAFESTPGCSDRPYFQNFVPPESDMVFLVRRLDAQATVSVIDAFTKSPHSSRLHRAAEQYRLALNYWRMGLEALSVAHLWMVLEAMTPVCVEVEIKQRGLKTRGELALSLGVKESSDKMEMESKLDAEVRRQLLLAGDDECYSNARKASDGLEHGYLTHKEVHTLSQSVRLRLARLVRAAILDLLGFEADVVSKLNAAPYENPVGHCPLCQHV
ncbi:MAG: hypothetical protein AABY65_05260 [Nitrospirota bacterium]